MSRSQLVIENGVSKFRNDGSKFVIYRFRARRAYVVNKDRGESRTLAGCWTHITALPVQRRRGRIMITQHITRPTHGPIQLQISPIPLPLLISLIHLVISPIQLMISPIQLMISAIQLMISTIHFLISLIL